METAELDFPPIEASGPAPAPAAVAAVTLQDAALAPFLAIEAPIRALAERYARVAYDCTTPKGFAAAKEARNDLRENGRYAVQRAADAFKKNANAAKKAVDAKADELVGIVKPAEDAIDAQIKAEEDRREKKRQEEARLEQERKDRLNEAVLRIYGYVKAATGMPAERIAKGIAYVETLAFGDEWQEYRGRAEEAKGEVLVQLRQLHADAIEAERLRQENEAQKAELDDIDRINDWANDCVARSSKHIETAITEFEEHVVPSLSKADRVQALIPLARSRMEAALAEAKTREEAPSYMVASPRAAATVTTSAGTVADANTGEVLFTPTDTSEAQPPQQVLKAEPAPQPADATDRGAAATASPGVGPMGVGQPADAGPAVGNDCAGQAPEAATPGTDDPTATTPDPAHQAAEEATFKLGDITGKLGFSMTGAFVGGTLGIAANKTERGALWYTPSRVKAIKKALLAHIEQVL